MIVKKLTNERIDELTIQIKEKLKKFSEKKSLYDKLKSGDFDQKFFAETCAFIRNEQKQKREEKEANEKWLAEREAKISAEKMTRRGPLLKPARLPTPLTTPASVGDTLNDEETKVKISDDKIIASKNFTPYAGTEPSLGSEKDNSTTLLSVPSTSNENSKLIRSSDDMVEEKVFGKVESPLAEDIKDDVDKDEYETASDGTVKMDTDETKSSAAEEATVDEGSEPEEVRPNAVKSHVVNELENSNDTIEETVSEQSSIPEAKKDGTQLNFLEPTKPSTSENSHDSFSSASKANESESSPQVANKKEHHLDIKVEEDSSISAMDASISNIEGKNNANVDNLESPIKRRRGRKSQKILGAPLMQTRSTRSQSHIKIEEPKERVEQIKKRLNSADETSVDNTISEESNDAKSSANDSAEVEFDEMWRQDAISIWRNVKNLGKAPMFLQPTSEAAESCRKLVRRQMDLSTIRRRIETGQIRNRVEFKRDLMVMFANVYMSHSSKHRTYKIAEEMEKDSLKLCEQKHEQKITRAHEKTSLTPDVSKNTALLNKLSVSYFLMNVYRFTPRSRQIAERPADQYQWRGISQRIKRRSS